VCFQLAGGGFDFRPALGIQICHALGLQFVTQTSVLLRNAIKISCLQKGCVHLCEFIGLSAVAACVTKHVIFTYQGSSNLATEDLPLPRVLVYLL